MLPYIRSINANPWSEFLCKCFLPCQNAAAGASGTAAQLGYCLWSTGIVPTHTDTLGQTSQSRGPTRTSQTANSQQRIYWVSISGVGDWWHKNARPENRNSPGTLLEPFAVGLQSWANCGLCWMTHSIVPFALWFAAKDSFQVLLRGMLSGSPRGMQGILTLRKESLKGFEHVLAFQYFRISQPAAILSMFHNHNVRSFPCSSYCACSYDCLKSSQFSPPGLSIFVRWVLDSDFDFGFWIVAISFQSLTPSIPLNILQPDFIGKKHTHRTDPSENMSRWRGCRISGGFWNMISVPTGQVPLEHLPLCALVSCIVI